jgi:hypothetical protein
MVKRIRTLCALLAAVLTLPCAARAEPMPNDVRLDTAVEAPPPGTGPDASAEVEARRAFEQGVEALRAERWAEAESAFRSSLRFLPRASTQYDLAFALFRQGRSVESLEVLNDLLKSTKPDEDAEYRELAKSLMVRIVADFPPKRAEAKPAESASIAEPPRRETRRRDESSFLRGPAPWLTIGVGAALLVSGAVTGILAKSADDEVIAGCPTLERCDETVRDARDRAAALGQVTDVLLVAGGVVVAAGVTWRLVVPASRPAASGPHGLFVAAGGRF